MTEVEVVVVRHGETDSNRSHTIQVQENISLDENISLITSPGPPGHSPLQPGPEAALAGRVDLVANSGEVQAVLHHGQPASATIVARRRTDRLSRPAMTQ